jgi:soluble lytic murein transglycosylase
MKFKILIIGVLMGLLLVGCGLPAQFDLVSPTSTPSAAFTSTISPSPTLTPTPTPTPTPMPSARIELGDRAMLNGDWETALLEFQNALANSTDPQVQAAAWLGIGRTQLLAGNYDEAISALEYLIGTYPDSPETAPANFYLGQAYANLERYTDAALAYSRYLDLRPAIIDAYILDLRGDALFAAGNYMEAASDYMAILDKSSQIDLTNVQMRAARAYALGGDPPSALTIYDSLLGQSIDDNTKALIYLRKGQIYAELGQTDQANSAYLEAVMNYPTSYDSYQALLALVEAEVTVNELNRGLVDYFAGQYGVALAAFDRYLQNNPADSATAYYYSGMTNRALGGYQAAIQQWDKVIQNYSDHPYWDRAWEQKAYTQWYYLDQYSEAIQTLQDFASSVPSHPRAAEFLFDAAQVAERAGKLDQAADLWERVINLYPEYEQAIRALFLSGIAHYRSGDYAGAYLSFQRLLGLTTAKYDQSMAYFWTGKTQLKLSDEAAALASWEEAANADPTGYYSERARETLQRTPPFTPPSTYDLGFDIYAERTAAKEWMRNTFNLPPDVDLDGPGDLENDPNLLRGAALWELGLYLEARIEFEVLRTAALNDPVKSFHLADYLAQLGLYRSATLAARQVLNLAGMDDAQTMNAPAFFNHLRFGTYYSDLILPLSQKYNIHPLLIYSLIRQESLFESFVQSSSAASGLMQVMPATGAEIAKDLDWPPEYSERDLYRPIVNLTFGLDYLDSQRTAFDNDLFAVLAAYNGGPGNALEWARLAEDDPDLFLEVIRYAETRDYVRRIFETFNIYRRLFNRSP